MMKPRLFKPKIQSKLTLAFLVMGLVPLLLSTFIVVKLNTNRVDREIREKIERASQEFGRIIDDYREKAKLRAEIIGHSPEFRKTLPTLEKLTVTQPLRVPGTGKPTIIWEPGRMPGMDYSQEKAKATETILLIQAFQSKTLAISAVLPVRKEGKVVGNLIVAYLLERAFTEYLANLTGVSVRIDPEPFLTKGATKKLGDIPFTPQIRKKVLKEKIPYYDEKAIFKGEPYQALYQPLFGSDRKIQGILFLGVPRRYSFPSIVSGWQFFGIIVGLGIFMAAALGYTIARRISKTINLFAGVARSVAEGKLDQEIRVRGKDEIGDLASAFNLMIGRLRQMRKLEEELRRKDRLAALGELSAGVAHEIRNPLGIIKNSAQVLQDKLKNKDAKSKELTDFIIEEANRLNKVVTNFLDFARPQRPSLEVREIPPLIEKSLERLESQTPGTNIKVVKRYEQGLPPAPVDDELLSQVFLNLITNAFQAMPEGGTLTITAQAEKTENRKPKTIKISFSDTGCGIPETGLPKVFNPFFSIRQGGTGLGLSIVHKIVESHGGEISVESQVGKGTVFTLRLSTEEK